MFCPTFVPKSNHKIMPVTREKIEKKIKVDANIAKSKS
jgi:hypothetical protein